MRCCIVLKKSNQQRICLKNMIKPYKTIAFSFLILCFSNCTFKGQTHKSGNLEADPLSEKQLAKLKVFEKSDKKPFLIEIKDYDKMLTTEIAENLHFVKLETNSECLFSKIDKVFFVEDKFFIFDRSIAKNIFVFDKNGKFLNKITKIGEGPNEIKNPKSFIVDEQSKNVIVFNGLESLFTMILS